MEDEEVVVGKFEIFEIEFEFFEIESFLFFLLEKRSDFLFFETFENEVDEIGEVVNEVNEIEVVVNAEVVNEVNEEASGMKKPTSPSENIINMFMTWI